MHAKSENNPEFAAVKWNHFCQYTNFKCCIHMCSEVNNSSMKKAKKHSLLGQKLFHSDTRMLFHLWRTGYPLLTNAFDSFRWECSSRMRNRLWQMVLKGKPFWRTPREILIQTNNNTKILILFKQSFSSLTNSSSG